MRGQQDHCGWRMQASQEEQSCQPCTSRHHSLSALPETLSGVDWPDQSPADPQSPTTPTPGWLDGHRWNDGHTTIFMVDINDNAGWLICKPVNGTLNKLMIKASQQKIYRCFRCCTALRWNIGLIGERACMFSSSSSWIWMCSCTFLYKQAEVGCLFFYLLLSCLIFLYILLNSLFSGCFLTFLLFNFFLLSVIHAFSLADFPWCTLQILTFQDKSGLNRFVQLSAFSIALTCSFPIEAVRW